MVDPADINFTVLEVLRSRNTYRRHIVEGKLPNPYVFDQQFVLPKPSTFVHPYYRCPNDPDNHANPAENKYCTHCGAKLLDA